MRRLIALCTAWAAACVPGEPEPPTSADADTDADADADTDVDTGTTTTLGDAFEAPFLWAPIPLDGAVDLGHVPAPIPADQRAEARSVRFTEVGEQAGLGEAVAGGNIHGVGVGFFDFDGDGWEDILVASGASHPSSLWRNGGDGTFTDVSEASGVTALVSGRDTYSVAAGDYDADGDVDVYLGAHPTSILLRNEGDGTFTDQTVTAGAGGPPSTEDLSGSSKIGALGDVDGDGWLDIFVASSTFDDAPRHGYLLRNEQDGTFSDASASTQLQVSATGNPCAVMWTDYDNDGDQDLQVWNDRGRWTENRSLLRNDGGVFVDVTQTALLVNPVGNPMGIDGADVDRDGFLDYYIGNIGGNVLMLAQGDGTFVDWAIAAGVQGSYGWGLGFEDLNADGWWDLFVAQEDQLPYLSFTHLQTDPPTFAQHQWSHPTSTTGHNVPAAFADYDHDGDVDVVTANTDGHRIQLFRNDTERGTNRFVEVRIARAPGTGEGTGISARVVVKAGRDVWWRDVTGGSSRASQSALTTRFGIGHRTGADLVGVLFPDGRTMAAIDVPGDTRVVLTP